MSAATHTIDHSTLEHLAQAGAVRGACVVGQRGGWGVVIEYGEIESTLTAKQGGVRVFKRFDTLAGYLKKVGIVQFKTDIRAFDPAAMGSKKRQDSADRMKNAHAAAAYVKWFEAEVQQGLQEADDPATQWVSNETMTAESAKRRELWAKQARSTS